MSRPRERIIACAERIEERTFDFQRIRNPAYNADRGPVTVESLRMHIEL